MRRAPLRTSTHSSVTSGSLKNLEQATGKSFWKNRVQQLFFFLGYCVNIRAFCAFIYDDAVTNPDYIPTFLQTVLVCAVVGGPLIFIQMFIGQFTQKGCIAVGSMVPAMYGFGYCMMVVAILDCVLNLYYCATSLMYLITSLLNFSYPVWMYCSDEMYKRFPNCFSRADIDLCVPCSQDESKPCFEPGSKILSASLFRFMIAFEKETSILDPALIGPPQMKSFIHAFLIMLTVYIVSCRRLKSLDLSLRISLIFCLLGVTGTTVVALADKNIWAAMTKLVSLELASFVDVKVWMAAFRRVTEALKISSGGHVFLGSYMMPDTASHFRTVYLIGYYILIILIFYCHYHLIEILLQCRLNMSRYGVSSADDIVYVMFPTALGLTATPRLWCTLFFTVFCILGLISMIILVDETISEEFKIGEYYMYTRCVLCIVVFILCLPLLTLGGRFIARTMVHELKIMNLLIITLTFIVIFLYNIQRLNDDIHFVLNTPPTWYVQACWTITAFITGSVLLFQIWQYQSDNRFYMVRLAMYSMVGSPILIGFVTKLLQYVKKQNITGIIRPSMYYGPPDINSRLMRLLYNPRLEVRYMRRKDICKHRCLLNNEIVVKAIEKELMLLEQVADDLQRNEEYRGEYSDVIAQLKEHHSIMYLRFLMITEQAGPKSKLYS